MKNKEITTTKEYKEEYETIIVNAATGDQRRIIYDIDSQAGQITNEKVKEFHDKAVKTLNQWKINNSGVRNVTLRILQDVTSGNSEIINLPQSELIFPDGRRARIYDKHGQVVVGEENIRREIERREEEWDWYERNGRLKQVDYAMHHFDDGSVATIYSRIPVDENGNPVKLLHPNEINDPSFAASFSIAGNTEKNKSALEIAPRRVGGTWHKGGNEIIKTKDGQLYGEPVEVDPNQLGGKENFVAQRQQELARSNDNHAELWALGAVGGGIFLVTAACIRFFRKSIS